MPEPRSEFHWTSSRVHEDRGLRMTLGWAQRSEEGRAAAQDREDEGSVQAPSSHAAVRGALAGHMYYGPGGTRARWVRPGYKRDDGHATEGCGRRRQVPGHVAGPTSAPGQVGLPPRERATSTKKPPNVSKVGVTLGMSVGRRPVA